MKLNVEPILFKRQYVDDNSSNQRLSLRRDKRKKMLIIKIKYIELSGLFRKYKITDWNKLAALFTNNAFSLCVLLPSELSPGAAYWF